MALPADRVITSPTERRSTVLEVIAGAKRHIALSLFRCNDDGIFAELERATKRGVSVEVLVTPRAQGNPKKLEKLRAALLRTGAAVSTYGDPVVKYHAKYIVADDGPAVVASLNFTRKCFTRTLDALVVTFDPAVVSSLRALMAADRVNAPLPDGLSPRLIIGPERARLQLTGLVHGARKSIRLIDAKLSDPGLMALLNVQMGCGVSVETFRATRVAGMTSHGKILLVDDSIAVVGGLAFAAISLDFRREVAIRLDTPTAVDDVRRLFDTVAASTKEAEDTRRLKSEV
jgi:phosphatidylserine/phosphatidylglycerophosphate/cardiolipin synthase-like enzyme